MLKLILKKMLLLILLQF